MPINTDILNKLLIDWDNEPDKSTGLINVDPDDLYYKFIVHYTPVGNRQNQGIIPIIHRNVISYWDRNSLFLKKYGRYIYMDTEEAYKLYDIIVSRIKWLYESEERLKSVIDGLNDVAGIKSDFFDKYGTGIFTYKNALWKDGWDAFVFLFAVQDIFIKIDYNGEKIYSGKIADLTDNEGLQFFGRFLQSIRENSLATIQFPEGFAWYIISTESTISTQDLIHKMRSVHKFSINPDKFTTAVPWPSKYPDEIKKLELWKVLKSYALKIYNNFKR